MPNAIAANEINEKQGLADIFGPDAGVIGAVMGALAAVGVAIMAISVVSLNTDQDSICTTVGVCTFTNII